MGNDHSATGLALLAVAESRVGEALPARLTIGGEVSTSKPPSRPDPRPPHREIIFLLGKLGCEPASNLMNTGFLRFAVRRVVRTANLVRTITEDDLSGKEP